MQVNPHTSLKHRILGVYFLICREVMKKRPLYYVDLYAGDGECECDEAPMKKWDCPFIKSLLSRAKLDNLKLTCFLNELDPGNEGIFERLSNKIEPYTDNIASLTREDANIVYKKILNQISNNEWSIFFLDPFKHSDLNWRTIEEISKHQGYDSITGSLRKPELIITLMTSTMQRGIKNPDSITQALGTDEWMKAINESEEKMHIIFSDIFINQIEKLNYEAISFQITQTLPYTNVLYYLIFASNIPGAINIINDRFKPYIDKIIREKWIKENFICRMMTRAQKQGYKTLDEFFPSDKND